MSGQKLTVFLAGRLAAKRDHQGLLALMRDLFTYLPDNRPGETVDLPRWTVGRTRHFLQSADVVLADLSTTTTATEISQVAIELGLAAASHKPIILIDTVNDGTRDPLMYGLADVTVSHMDDALDYLSTFVTGQG